MTDLLDRIRHEPALISGLVVAILAVFGLSATDADVSTIEHLVAFAVPLVSSLVVRSKVTPV